MGMRIPASLHSCEDSVRRCRPHPKMIDQRFQRSPSTKDDRDVKGKGIWIEIRKFLGPLPTYLCLLIDVSERWLPRYQCKNLHERNIALSIESLNYFTWQRILCCWNAAQRSTHDMWWRGEVMYITTALSSYNEHYLLKIIFLLIIIIFYFSILFI